MTKFLDLGAVNARYADEIRQAVLRTLDSGRYLQGEENRQFEKEYAAYIGTRYAVGCANGLDALTLILRAYIEMGLLQPGDQVLVPAHTFIASILAITENALEPVLVEPLEDTLFLDESRLEGLLTPRCRALMLVHLYGRCTYTEGIADFCRRHGLLLIEDNAQAHGCRYDGRRTGSLGHAAGHSFYPSKNLGALGDAGAVTTDDETLAGIVRTLANYGSSSKYIFPYCGRNSRMDELQAAVLRVRLRHLDADNDRRRRNAAYYYEHIDHPQISLPRRLPDEQNVYHIFPVYCDCRDRLQAYLLENGVETMVHYPLPPHRQACYRDWPPRSLPVTERLHDRELSLPVGPVLGEDEIARVVRLLNAFRG